MLRQALDGAGILPRLRHFKHETDDDHPNEYRVYLELNETLDAAACAALAEQWQPSLLEALMHLPAASDLAAAHRANPIELKVVVRARGEGEFTGDEEQAKASHVLRRTIVSTRSGPGAPRTSWS
jgi:hypothetical protein